MNRRARLRASKVELVGVELGEIVRAEIDGLRADVLLQVRTRERAGDRNDHRRAGEQPGERDLCRRCTVPGGDGP